MDLSWDIAKGEQVELKCLQVWGDDIFYLLKPSFGGASPHPSMNLST